MPSIGTPTQLGGRLTLEWTRLRTRPAALRIAGSWRLLDHPVDDLDEVLAAIGYETSGDPATEARLRRLVAIAATDDLAARVVVQRLLPGLLAVVRRRHRLGDRGAVFDELLGAAWIAIRTFNPSRRPACLAAALISDADYAAFRAPRRRRSGDEKPVEPVDRPDETPVSALDELADLLRLAPAAGIEPDELDLVRRLLLTPKVVDLARELSVTPRTVRNRRDRIASRLREVALAA